jgi:hypothetical protein
MTDGKSFDDCLVIPAKRKSNVRVRFVLSAKKRSYAHWTNTDQSCLTVNMFLLLPLSLSFYGAIIGRGDYLGRPRLVDICSSENETFPRVHAFAADRRLTVKGNVNIWKVQTPVVCLDIERSIHWRRNSRYWFPLTDSLRSPSHTWERHLRLANRQTWTVRSDGCLAALWRKGNSVP